MSNKYLLSLAIVLFSLGSIIGQKISGVTMVAPPDPIDSNAIKRIKETNAQWICFVPYGYHRKGQTKINFNVEWQWWGEKEEGLRKCLDLAKSQGMKIMLKPQVYIPNSWVGDMNYSSEQQWMEWEKSYATFINYYVDLATEFDVDMVCIGTEYKIAVKKREKFWRALIKKIRSKYKGAITYSANWDHFEEVPIWDALDYIGLSSYFPLTDEITPSIDHLLTKWKPITKRLKSFSERYGKKILFTEYGYLTIDRCAYRAWELEKVINRSAVNQDAQANAFSALFNTFSNKDWWAGGFLWKWFPDGMGHEGYVEKDYTPQDKKAEQVIRIFHQLINEL